MGNFLKILAASVGGGIVLGAGIRLGEALATREAASPGAPEDDRLAGRIGALESRLRGLEGGFESAKPAVIATRFEAHEAELAAVRAQLNKEKREVEDIAETATRLRGELQDWLETSVSTRIAEAETRLRTESERSQRQMLDAFVESVQTRVIQRISSLEGEVASQSAAMGELRECSLRTEQSMQKLLGGLDRIIVKYPTPQEASVTPSAAVADKPEAIPPDPPASPALPSLAAEPRKRSRWSIFG